MEKTQSKTKKTAKPVAKKSQKKETETVSKKTTKKVAVKSVAVQKVSKTPTKSTKKVKEIIPPVEKTVAKKTTKSTTRAKAVKKAPVKTVTVVLDDPVVETQTTPVLEQQTSVEPAKKTRNIFQLYFDSWLNMFSFEGRASRTEFLVFWNVSILLFPLLVPYSVFSTNLSYAIIVAFSLLIAALFTLSVRRFHDIGRSGVWGALLFILVFGILSTLASLPQFAIIYIFSIFGYFILSLISGTKGPNKYGDEPVKPSKVSIALNTLLSYALVLTAVELIRLLVIFFEYYLS